MRVRSFFIKILEKYRVIWRLLTVLYGILILFLCTTGVENLPKNMFFWDYIDIIYHFSGFCIFSFLLRGAFYTHNKDKSFKLTLLFGLTWAIICETLQMFIPTRSFTLADLSANCVGIIIVQFIINSCQKKFDLSSADS